MQFSVFLVAIACVLNVALAVGDEKVLQVESELMDYVQENLGQVRMMRGSTKHITCYDRFTSLIASITESARRNSETCVNDADEKRSGALVALRSAREELSGEVQRIRTSLDECTKREEGLGYFECLLELVEEDKRILDNIASRSRALIQQHGITLSGIDESEQECLQRAVDSAKGHTDSAFGTLRQCLRTGPETE